MARLREKYKTLPLYMVEYVNGFRECYRKMVVDRQFIESGAWVLMPDGSNQYFGCSERVEMKEPITHRYIYENAITGTKGLYWVADPKRNRTPGQYPFFICSE